MTHVLLNVFIELFLLLHKSIKYNKKVYIFYIANYLLQHKNIHYKNKNNLSC